ncbi:insulin-like growth factor 2 mRNA-binding protein 1 isoform X2 [Ischnura elegans]|uniref:insulin-like growth factor 2 mRNA-binding protein 1 isoform X2 n=1 Tax=Ischnura elegans TaxID=197161 RepID=UPI001ED889F3|nr:insulin-like growth factor 2 mRNA-binding protein 1 isoform X2 [Ischnura elegans]
MSKLYVGNLPADVTEGTLRQLLLDHSVTCATILVKRGGYAFVDCPDQSMADRAIDKLNGFNFLGSTLVVEPSVAGGTKKRGPGGVGDAAGEHVGNGWSGSNTRIVVSNIPPHVRFEDLEPLLTPFGPVQNCEKLSGGRGGDGATQAVQIGYESLEQAQQAVNQLNGCEFEGASLKVELAMERGGGGGRGGRGGRGGPRTGLMPFSNMPLTTRQTDFPLRILVQSDMVGAIIGRQGSTIRQITQQTRARVDVHRKDNIGSLEKAITIYGNPENCTNACKRILEVMLQEASSTNKGEISLKILAHNNLIGRIIGKGGNTIKRIMQDTETKITVSSINEISNFNLERIITVKGSIENMSKAEAMISAKLRQSYENDLQAMAPQSLMFPGLHPMAMMSTAGMGFPSRGGGGGGTGGGSAGGGGGAGSFPPGPGGLYGSAPPPPHHPHYPSMYPSPMGPPPVGAQGPPGSQHGGDLQETTYLYIPNNAVGAIIGTKGTHIRNIIRFSGASVKIAPLEQEKGALVGPGGEPGQPPQQGMMGPQAERRVTIIGSPEAQWKAQYLIFEKMREEGFVGGGGAEEVRLTVEILVPSSQVGRIIGKGGQNVRELQRMTGSVVKLPPEQPVSSAGASGQGSPSSSLAPSHTLGEETTVHIIGPFYSVQSAQRRIRAMVMQAQPSGGPRRGGGGERLGQERGGSGGSSSGGGSTAGGSRRGMGGGAGDPSANVSPPGQMQQ